MAPTVSDPAPTQPRPARALGMLQSSQPPTYLSPRSANALISDLRPTQLHPQALHHLNLLLDELVVLLITSARSLNTEEIKHVALTSVFGGEGGARALGRTAVSEAEIELRSWMAAKPGRQALENDEKGLREQAEFPLEQALALLRSKVVAFSTLAAHTPNPELDSRLLASWTTAGGDANERAWAPASLYVTAIIEHVCEHILANVGRVVARDSSIAVATLQDLYVALCEDEHIWGLFKRMEVKSAIETSMRPSDRHRRAISKHAAAPASPASSVGASPNLPAAKMFATRSPSIDSLGPNAPRGKKSSNASNAGARSSTEISGNAMATGGISHIARAATPPSRGIRGMMAGSKHERSPSVLSNNTRSMLGAYDDAYGEEGRRERQQDHEADFDALVKSGETMKVSLTPSRLKNFEPTSSRVAHGSALSARPSNSQSHRDLSSRVSPALRASPSMGAMGPKLVARDTPVNEEGEMDDELAAKPKRRKESLIELLNSDPPWKDPEAPPPRKGSGGKAAALLGAVPSTGNSLASVRSRDVSAQSSGKAAAMLGPGGTIPRSSSLAKLQPRDDARSPLDDDENDFSFGDKPKTKSSAQELMDFLDNTPPPPPEASSPASVNKSTTSRKDSRFKSLVSKLTGSKEKERERGVGLSLQTPPVRRQPSFQAASASPAPPEAISRQPSRPKEAPAIVTSPQGVKSAEVISAVTAGPVLERKISKLRKSPSFERSPRANPPLLGPAIPIEDHYIGPSTGDAVVTSRDRPLSGAPFSADAQNMIGLGMNGVQLHGQGSPSSDGIEPDSAASEPDSEYETPATGVSQLSTPTQPKRRRPSIDTTPVVKPRARMASPTQLLAAEPVEGTIPLSDLVPLRGLLDHATSARECRLLLSAILSQWGVPGTEGSSPVSPESRVAAWLLAGREGPVDALPPSISSAPIAHEAAGAQRAELKSVEPVSTSDEDLRRSMDRSDEEVLSEFTSATDSLADLDLENGGSSTGVAKRQAFTLADAEVIRQAVAT